MMFFQVIFYFTVLFADIDSKIHISQLRKLNIKERPLTMSGFSSGGTMASQMQIAFSRSFDGVAAFSSIWYRCAPFGELFYHSDCNKGIYPVMRGVSDAKKYENDNLIDDLKNLKSQKFYHWIGEKDELANPVVRTQTRTFYIRVGMKDENIQLVYNKTAFHVMPTANSSETSCTHPILPDAAITGDFTGTAFCHYYGAYEGLKFLLGNSLSLSKHYPLTLEPLRLFNQSVFLTKDDQHYMDSVGFYYIPRRCKDGAKSCRLHLALHGCLGSRSRVKSQWLKRSGYLEIAEVNNIVMLFPQSIQYPGNREGCWDIFGSTDDQYATKNGVQMSALAKMIETVTGRRLG